MTDFLEYWSIPHILLSTRCLRSGSNHLGCHRSMPLDFEALGSVTMESAFSKLDRYPLEGQDCSIATELHSRRHCLEILEPEVYR